MYIIQSFSLFLHFIILLKQPYHMKRILVLTITSFLFSHLFAQNCDVSNGTFQNWSTVRLEHPVQTDSLDFFWPDHWIPFIWNGIDDALEPLVPGAGGVGDTAVAMYSTDVGANLSHYFLCEGNPSTFTGSYYHDGASDDSLAFSVFGVRVDTVGNSELDSLAVAVLFDEVDYEEVFVMDTLIVGGAQSFTSFSFPLDYFTNDTTANLVFVIASFIRGEGTSTEKRIYALDDIAFLGNNTALDEQFHASNALLQVYPNPAQTQITIEPPISEPYSLQIVNLQGQRVRNMEQLQGTVQLDLTGLSKGMYMLLLDNQERQLIGSKKFTIK